MAHVADHLSVAELKRRFRACPDPVEARHVQVVWLLAQGHTIGATSKVTTFGTRWIEQLLERYDASGPDALANGRHSNGLKPSLLTPEVLEMVRLRLAEPPPDGGLWSSRKVADVMASHLGLATLHARRDRSMAWEWASVAHDRPSLRAAGRSGLAQAARVMEGIGRTCSRPTTPARDRPVAGSEALQHPAVDVVGGTDRIAGALRA